MRLCILISFVLFSSACTQQPRYKPPTVQLPDIQFAALRYPQTLPLCTRTLESSKGYIRWETVLSLDSVEKVSRFYNKKAGLHKRKTATNHHLWTLDKQQPTYQSLASMSLLEANRLKLLCDKTIPSQANSAIIMGLFIPKIPFPRPKPSTLH